MHHFATFFFPGMAGMDKIRLLIRSCSEPTLQTTQNFAQ